MAAMQTAIFVSAVWLAVLAAQTGVQPSDRYREEFKLRPDTARISQPFSVDAWIVLLYAGRQSSTGTNHPQAEDVDGSMESLRNLVRTDGEWLFWYRLNNYSIAKHLATAHQADRGLVSVTNPDACRNALIVANRSRVMAASMPACELAVARTP